MSKVLINIIVFANNTSTTHTRGKQKSASPKTEKDKPVELIHQNISPEPTPKRAQATAQHYPHFRQRVNATDMRLKTDYDL
jgi:hypothetical protein